MDNKNMNNLKYPKTFHLSWSENLQNDDRKLESDDIFLNKNIIVSSKLDGENTGLSREKCHARSLDSRDDTSRHWIKSLHAQIKNDIPDNWKIFGENLFAKHSIFYDKLTTFFYVFLIIDNKENCLSWKETLEWCNLLGLETVPVLYQGIWDEEKVKACYTGKCVFGEEQEGYVVRNSESFLLKEFQFNMAKFVRKNHIKTKETPHWRKTWIPNKLK